MASPRVDLRRHNYVACTGSGNIGNGTIAGADGVFYLTSAVRFADMVDGSSNTACFSERTLGTGLTLTVPTLSQSDAALLYPRAGKRHRRQRAHVCDAGHRRLVQHAQREMDSRQLRQHAVQPFLPPNSTTYDCMNQAQQKGFMAARSNHPSGVNLLACDGSARFINSGIDLTVWQALATAAGSEAVEMP